MSSRDHRCEHERLFRVEEIRDHTGHVGDQSIHLVEHVQDAAGIAAVPKTCERPVLAASAASNLSMSRAAEASLASARPTMGPEDHDAAALTSA